jgi:hypothetical protein
MPDDVVARAEGSVGHQVVAGDPSDLFFSIVLSFGDFDGNGNG